jgi:hypothetical protein
MGLGSTAGSWTEGSQALLSTLTGALVFWLLGAAVGLCVSDAQFLLADALSGAESRSLCARTV